MSEVDSTGAGEVRVIDGVEYRRVFTQRLDSGRRQGERVVWAHAYRQLRDGTWKNVGGREFTIAEWEKAGE